MTVPFTIDAAGWLGKFLEAGDADVDLPRAMLQAFAEALMSAQASAQCGAAFGERSDERENSRNGYRHRPWDTRVGTIDLAVPKLRNGGYSPEFLLQPRRRAEQALIAAVCQPYGEGVPPRLAGELGSRVAEFRDRPLDNGPYRYMWIEALLRNGYARAAGS